MNIVSVIDRQTEVHGRRIRATRNLHDAVVLRDTFLTGIVGQSDRQVIRLIERYINILFLIGNLHARRLNPHLSVKGRQGVERQCRSRGTRLRGGGLVQRNPRLRIGRQTPLSLAASKTISRKRQRTTRDVKHDIIASNGSSIFLHSDGRYDLYIDGGLIIGRISNTSSIKFNNFTITGRFTLNRVFIYFDIIIVISISYQGRSKDGLTFRIRTFQIDGRANSKHIGICLLPINSC